MCNLLCQTKLGCLDISGITLNRMAAEDIATGVRCSRFLKHLSVSLAVDNIHLVFEALSDAFYSKIETLVACGTNINSKALLALAKFLQKTFELALAYIDVILTVGLCTGPHFVIWSFRQQD